MVDDFYTSRFWLLRPEALSFEPMHAVYMGAVSEHNSRALSSPSLSRPRHDLGWPFLSFPETSAQ
ncbi:hypothetical protein E4U54_005345, partial [Claviceps lovelessii]